MLSCSGFVPVSSRRLMLNEAPNSVERIVRERDLYRGLLELDESQAIEPFLESALRLTVQVTGAEQGYIELMDPAAAGEDDHFWTAAGCSDEELEDLRSTVSRGVVADAIATGEPVVTRSALMDPRFRDRSSVQRSHINAVLCMPIGDEPLGVVYLQRRTTEGDFTVEDQRLAKICGAHLARPARALLERRKRSEDDPTRPFRQRLRLDGVVGSSPALAKLLHDVSLIAPLDICALLTGETGTGKSRIARVIHENSSRAAAPFVEVNCAALPEGLIESELFGAMQGAHSTATRRVDGKVAAARGGTLLLDEIGELSLAAQAKLLQLLQDKEYFPLGASRAERADVRIVAATNVDLESAVTAKKFRQDLFYRLAVVPIRVPSLAERQQDVTELSRYFCKIAQGTHRLPELSLSPGAVSVLRARSWPGNVRELAHALEAACIRAAGESAAQIEVRHIDSRAKLSANQEASECTFHEATRRCQEELLRSALEATGWNVSQAARRLDLTRAHVYNLIRSLGIARQPRA
jgi:Nif-specific regulatory protein